jgi:hypothetical protein
MQNIDPAPPSPPGECVFTPAFGGGGGETTLAGWRRGWGVNTLEDARHSSVLYVCKYIAALHVPPLFLFHQQPGQHATYRWTPDRLDLQAFCIQIQREPWQRKDE